MSGLTDEQWSIEVRARDNFECKARIPSVCADLYRRPATVVAHHLKPRSAGGPNTVDNGLTVCVPCHGCIHANPKWARAKGLLKHSWESV